MWVTHDGLLPDRQAGQFLEALLESAEAFMAVVDLKGEIVCANQAWLDFKGNNPFLNQCGLGTDYLALCQQLVKVKSADFSIVALGILSILNGNVPRLRLEYPCKEGPDTFWFSLLATRSPVPGLGAVIRHTDITERMGSEQRLRRSESLFNLTIGSARDLIGILEIEGKLRYHSPSYRNALGYGDTELHNMDVQALIHPEDKKRFSAMLENGFQHGLSPLFEYRMLTKKEAWCEFEAQAAGVGNRFGEAPAVLLVSRDISQRKATELARAQMEIQLRHAQKMEAVGQLASGIAHEINTPTQFVGDNLRFLQDAFQSFHRIIQISSELASQAEKACPACLAASQKIRDVMETEELDYLSGEVPRALQQSLDGVERVSTIVKAMKIFSHPSTEGWVGVDINQAIENTLIVSRNEWKYVADVEKCLAPDLPHVVCSPGELNQVILNLIVNAAHAIGDTPHCQTGGKGCITLTTQATATGVEIRVADNGVGISAEQLPQIWLPFYTTKPVGKGTGQGLSIVHSVVQRHQGSIEVQSEPGKGTCFIVNLPLNPAPSEKIP